MAIEGSCSNSCPHRAWAHRKHGNQKTVADFARPILGAINDHSFIYASLARIESERLVLPHARLSRQSAELSRVERRRVLIRIRHIGWPAVAHKLARFELDRRTLETGHGKRRTDCAAHRSTRSGKSALHPRQGSLVAARWKDRFEATWEEAMTDCFWGRLQPVEGSTI